MKKKWNVDLPWICHAIVGICGRVRTSRHLLCLSLLDFKVQPTMYIATLGALLLALTTSCSLASGSTQTVLHGVQNSSTHGLGNTADNDLGFFTPMESLSYLSEQEFTTLKHPIFPNHNVRIKKSNFCDSNVRCVLETGVEFIE